jgi:predicted nucleotidyltransferase
LKAIEIHKFFPEKSVLIMRNEPTGKRNASFDISIWKRGLIERRHVRSRRRLQVVEKVWNAIERLSHTYKWNDLYIFGSAAKSDRFGEGSDIDIGIEGLDKFLHYRFIADLSRLIGREVDVVRFEDCNFTSAIKTQGIRWKKEK